MMWKIRRWLRSRRADDDDECCVFDLQAGWVQEYRMRLRRACFFRVTAYAMVNAEIRARRYGSRELRTRSQASILPLELDLIIVYLY